MEAGAWSRWRAPECGRGREGKGHGISLGRMQSDGKTDALRPYNLSGGTRSGSPTGETAGGPSPPCHVPLHRSAADVSPWFLGRTNRGACTF